MPVHKYRERKHDTSRLFREASVNRQDADDEARSIPIVLATDTPVEAFDFERFEVVDEVIDIAGVETPEQIPLIDTHNRSSVRNVIGSIRNFQKDGGKLRARAFFAADAADIFRKYRDGDLDAFSIGAGVEEVKFTERKGQNTLKTITKSIAREGSAVIFGADPNALAELEPAMRAYLGPHQLLEETMDTKLKELLVSRGLPEDAEGKSIVEWVEHNLKPDDDASEREQSKYDEMKDEIARRLRETGENSAGGIDKPTHEDVIRAERQRQKDISELYRQNKDLFDEAKRDEWLNSDVSADEVAHAILRQRAATGRAIGNIHISEAKEEKLHSAMSDGLAYQVTRGRVNPSKALDNCKERFDPDGVRRAEELVRVYQKPADGSDVFRQMSLSEMARLYLEETGVDTRRMTKRQWCERAMKHPGLFVNRADDPAYHTTGSFTNILIDAANKTLRAAYDEHPATYERWVRQAASVADFKTIHRTSMGSLVDPQVVPENDDYPETTAGDQRETYTVEKYGSIFSHSFEMTVNDDLDALSRLPAMHGNAMRRLINKVCYAILIDNDALADGVALFHATSHGANLDTTTLAESALDTGFNVMMTQTDPTNANTTLNIMPRYLIVPAALSATAFRITGGNVIPESVSNVPIYGSGANTPRPLQVVPDAELDGDSTTAWYLAADPNVVDTVEISFLQGFESPEITQEEGFSNDAMRMKIKQVFGVKAIDYVGLYQGNT